MAGKNDESEIWEGDPLPGADGQLGRALGELESALVDACAGEEVWPAQIAAGVYAGVDFVIENPNLARAWVLDSASNIDYSEQYEWMIARLTRLIRMRAPAEGRLPASSDEALVAGIVGLVGDHIRVGRLDRLADLRPELVQLTLLPYLGFVESRRWANRSAGLD